MKKRNEIRECIIALYVFLPIIIFLMTWIKWWIGIPASVVVIICIINYLRNNTAMNKKISRSQGQLVPIIILIILWVFFSGIGGMVFQNRDHVCRNAMFDILVNMRWPVIDTVEVDGILENRGLVYYIGFWLPAAIVGKLFGISVGYAFQMFWAILGIFLTSCLMFEHFGHASAKVILGFIFFSGLDIVGCLLVGTDFNNLEHFMHIEWWSGFQFSSFTTQLFWVFNQAIYAWLITLMIMRQKSNRYIVLIWSCGLLTCTLPFAGLLPFVIYQIVKNTYVKFNVENVKKQTIGVINNVCQLCRKSELFTWENILGGGSIGIICFLYAISNISATNSGQAVHYTKGYLFLYVLFILLEVGVYALAIYKYQYKNPLYWLSIVVLAVCPWIHVGSGQDFCMRASIPALLILMILVMDTWRSAKKYKDYFYLVVIAVIYLLGAVTPLGEFWRTARNTTQLYREGQTIMAESVPEEEIMGAPNFSGGVDQSFFYKYLAK